MIIWINGAFGVGKSTIAEVLNSKLIPSFVFDPEQVGAFLWDNFPNPLKNKGDFQDIEIWRSINFQILNYLSHNYFGDIIVPMTITNIVYYDEIIGSLINAGVDVRHYILSATKENIIKRLSLRGEKRGGWAEMQIDRCLNSFYKSINQVKIDTDNKSIDSVVEHIICDLNNYRTKSEQA
jgi:ATP-binding membrane protein